MNLRTERRFHLRGAMNDNFGSRRPPELVLDWHQFSTLMRIANTFGHSSFTMEEGRARYDKSSTFNVIHALERAIAYVPPRPAPPPLAPKKAPEPTGRKKNGSRSVAAIEAPLPRPRQVPIPALNTEELDIADRTLKFLNTNARSGMVIHRNKFA